jgi:hypothetical protein
MTPDFLVAELVRIAAAIDASRSPSRSRVLHAVAGLCARTATDKSLAKALADQLSSAVLALFPSGTFQDKLFDTHEEGKRFLNGSVSFGLRPMAFENAGIVGGILITASYSPQVIRSDSPEPETPEHKAWMESGGNKSLKGGETEIAEVSARYYNKNEGGGTGDSVPIGSAIFSVSKTEDVEGLELDDPSKLSSAVNSIIDGVLKDPPEGSRSKNRVKNFTRERANSPYANLKKFINYLYEEGRKTFTGPEVKEIARWTNKPESDILDFLRKRNLSMASSPLSERRDYGA